MVSLCLQKTLPGSIVYMSNTTQRLVVPVTSCLKLKADAQREGVALRMGKD